MSYRVAFASSDGKVINQHFGRIRKLLIFEIGDKSAEYIELRENKPPCQGFEYTEKAINKSVNLISDCKAIFVTNVEHGALEQLNGKGIRAFETPGFISEIIGKILSASLKI